MLPLLLATANPAKLAEYRELLQGVPYTLVGLAKAGIAGEVPEAGTTLEENAVSKAQAYATRSGLLSLADDSGLEVDALGGEPGPLSKRYAGEGATDPVRIAFLLRKLEGIPWEKRSARFRCVIALASSGGWLEIVQGEALGYIAFEPVGEGGFGYDPVFFYPPLGKTFAQLTAGEKNRVSHRGQAATRARRILELMAGHAQTPG
ncbi:MAG: RdgB/HAM1 family non-canonical purine NTP pyrophosphatase [Chloroflexi bacterium]|nr:RdgB/HAM1 family non-canonical purine NTP pyrophosphatase [Chloroflexota bacterium]